MQCPGVLRQHLSLGLESGIGIPELGAQNQSTEGLGAARICHIGEGIRGAGQEVRF